MIKHIFFDDGGVLNDNSTRGSQWGKLIGEYFAPKYGRDPQDWAGINQKYVEYLILKMDNSYEESIGELPPSYFEDEDREWIEYQFEQLGLDIPNDPITLSRVARSWITERVDCSYPGIIDLIHELSEDYELFTASNEVSFELEGYLKGMGVHHHFSGFYGSDLLHCFKTSKLYYERLVEQTKVNPSEAIVIDDKVKNLNFAKEVGFNTIHSGLEGHKPDNHPYYVEVQQLKDLINSFD